MRKKKEKEGGGRVEKRKKRTSEDTVCNIQTDCVFTVIFSFFYSQEYR